MTLLRTEHQESWPRRNCAGLIAAGAVLAASLIGALLGGLAGMRFHRKVDRTGLGH